MDILVIAQAIAIANGHPDPVAYAEQVKAIYESLQPAPEKKK